jgi:hypothetical protein
MLTSCAASPKTRLASTGIATLLAQKDGQELGSLRRIRCAVAIEGMALQQWFGATMNLLSTQTRLQLVSAIFLALIAGYLDGYGLLFLGTYVSFMSGNTTFTGLKSGQGNFQAALPSAVAVLSFVTGSFLGNLLSQSKLRYSHRLILRRDCRPAGYGCWP